MELAQEHQIPLDPDYLEITRQSTRASARRS
jgi:hypothetical protein